MTPSGWLVLIISILSTIALFSWCVYKVFTIPRESDHVHGFEQDPPDL